MTQLNLPFVAFEQILCLELERDEEWCFKVIPTKPGKCGCYGEGFDFQDSSRVLGIQKQDRMNQQGKWDLGS